MHINTLARHRGLNFAREGEDTGGGGGGAPAGSQGAGGASGKEQQQSEFKPPASQEELDRIVTARLQRERAKYSDYEVLQEKAGLWDQLAEESRTDAERRETELRAEAFNEAMSVAVPLAIRAEFKFASVGVLDKDQLDSLLEDLDLTKYANEDGTPDEEKIAKKIAAFGPKNGGSGQNGGPGFGQGNGYQRSSGRPGEAGIAAAQKRWPQLAEKKS